MAQPRILETQVTTPPPSRLQRPRSAETERQKWKFQVLKVTRTTSENEFNLTGSFNSSGTVGDARRLLHRFSGVEQILTVNKESFESKVLKQKQHCIAVAVAVMISQTRCYTTCKAHNFESTHDSTTLNSE